MKFNLLVLIGTITLLFSCVEDGKSELEELKDRLDKVGEFKEYQPEEPIEFSHKVHADVQGIDCKYCHNAHSKTEEELVSHQVCTDCHKGIPSTPDTNNTWLSHPKTFGVTDSIPDSFSHKDLVLNDTLTCSQCHY